ncbi:MAG: ATP-dependent RecD-like DNA helicase [Thermodesulfobacteriota bacterium]|nr:ATP-dependent RecD-like DNA helicase [Thermodesulfobacteriota bacterium]
MRVTELAGQIERVTFSSEESGYTVARVKVKGERDLVTIVGGIANPSPGEILVMQGKWVNHLKFGMQFHVETYQTKVPATELGITKYLGSGLIKGIGPVMAKRIVKCFGAATLDIIEHDTPKLSEVEGIGKKRVCMIKQAWDDQKEIREVMLFLQSHGVSSGYAAKIFKRYGNESIEIVTQNPYRLAEDIFGIGFVTADKIAEKLGMERDAPARIEAGILYVLHKLSDEGHACFPYAELVQKIVEILEVNHDLVLDAVGRAVIENKIVIEDVNDDFSEFKENNKHVFLAKYHFCEKGISARLKRLGKVCSSIRAVDSEKALEWVENQLTINLAGMQKQAVKSALDEKVLVITGGPGTGKTTIINAVIRIYSRLDVRIILAAPTGRAAKRMSEATGLKAVTIHRLLEYSMQKAGFQKNGKNQLSCDLLIIDEASMIDTILMHHLLKAVPETSLFVLVGDVNQLPSVGAGKVLNDIISSGLVNVTRLETIFRQAEKSMIVVNAHRINKGLLPGFNKERGKKNSDFFFIQREEPEAVLNTILDLVTRRIPKGFGFDAFNDIQVLTPMHKGTTGTGNFNQELQRVLNPGNNGVKRGVSEFRVADKVMQIKNNYDKDVYNGDIGRISRIDFTDQNMIINFDSKDVEYDFSELDEIVHAYAVSVHKSQGSEYPAVIIPVTTQHYVLLQRNLIYTAVTRGKRLVVLVGTKKALAMAVKNNKTSKRYTGLEQRLKQ